MKRFLAILCGGTMALGLTACGASPAAQTNQAVEGVALTFTDEGITGTGTGFETDGTALTITDSGTYTLSGTCVDGSVKVKKGVTGVTLVLDGLDLTSADTAPITCGKSTEVTIEAAAGTVNTLTDSEDNNDDNNPDNANAENAVIKCKDGSQVTLSGTGTLTLNGNGKNGIKSGATTEEEGEASLTVRDLTLNITAVNDGVNAEQLLNVESGTVTVSAGDDGLHSDYVLNVGAEDTDGPNITITESYEGLEGAELNVYSGNVSIHSEDDCMNAANGDLSDYDFTLNISGGTLVMDTVSGDGIDSNGDLTITGGSVTVWTANTADNQPLDADGTISITGGTVLAAGGSAGMGMNLSAEQPYVVFGSQTMEAPGAQQTEGGISIAEGDAVALTNGDGTVVYSGTALCNARFLFFSSPDLTEGTAYTLKSGETELASGEATTEAMTESFGGPGGGGMGGPGQRPDGENGTPPELPDGAAQPEKGGTPPEMPSGDGQNGGTPPAKPDGNGGNPPEKPDGQTQTAETAGDSRV